MSFQPWSIILIWNQPYREKPDSSVFKFIKIQKKISKEESFSYPAWVCCCVLAFSPLPSLLHVSHRWNQFRVGSWIVHYEKAGDLTSAMLTLTALAMLIVGIWLQPELEKSLQSDLPLCYAVGATMVVLLMEGIWVESLCDRFWKGKHGHWRWRGYVPWPSGWSFWTVENLLSGHANAFGICFDDRVGFRSSSVWFSEKKVAWLGGIFPEWFLYASVWYFVNWEKWWRQGRRFSQFPGSYRLFSTGTVTSDFIGFDDRLPCIANSGIRIFRFFSVLLMSPGGGHSHGFSLIFEHVNHPSAASFWRCSGVEPLRWIADNTPITVPLRGGVERALCGPPWHGHRHSLRSLVLHRLQCGDSYGTTAI